MYQQIEEFIEYLMKNSTPDAPAWNIENIRQGKAPAWHYVDGCMMTALSAYGAYKKDPRFADFVEHFIDYYVDDAGEMLGYHEESYNLDNINEGRVLFELYERTGKEKYRLAIERLHRQLVEQPRTVEGNFWHKRIYPNQVWLDGIYMAQPFAALYEKNFGNGDYSDVTHQIDIVRKYMYHEGRGLYFHGFDSSKKAFWCDGTDGTSANFWLRAIGWFAVALADLIEICGPGEGHLVRIFRELMAGVTRYADEKSGMYYQVVDRLRWEGNYLETSGSAMIAYACLKGARLGVLPKKYAASGKKTFDGIIDKYFSYENGTYTLGGICLMAGLGPEDNRRRNGSYQYYISEPVVENDAKGVAPFVLCYSEIVRLTDR